MVEDFIPFLPWKRTHELECDEIWNLIKRSPPKKYIEKDFSKIKINLFTLCFPRTNKYHGFFGLKSLFQKKTHRNLSFFNPLLMFSKKSFQISCLLQSLFMISQPKLCFLKNFFVIYYKKTQSLIHFFNWIKTMVLNKTMEAIFLKIKWFLNLSSYPFYQNEEKLWFSLKSWNPFS